MDNGKQSDGVLLAVVLYARNRKADRAKEKFEEKFEYKGKDLPGYPAAAIMARNDVWGP